MLNELNNFFANLAPHEQNALIVLGVIFFGIAFFVLGVSTGEAVGKFMHIVNR